jgi:hypothetical protein
LSHERQNDGEEVTAGEEHVRFCKEEKKRRETHPKRLRNPNISIRTPKKGYLRKTRAIPTTNAAAVRGERQEKMGKKYRQLPFLEAVYFNLLLELL